MSMDATISFLLDGKDNLSPVLDHAAKSLMNLNHALNNTTRASGLASVETANNISRGVGRSDQSLDRMKKAFVNVGDVWKDKSKTLVDKTGALSDAMESLADYTYQGMYALNVFLGSAYSKFQNLVTAGDKLSSALISVRQQAFLTRVEGEELKKTSAGLAGVLGLSAEEMQGMFAVAAKMGLRGSKQMKEFVEFSGDLSAAMGLNAEATAKMNSEITRFLQVAPSQMRELDKVLMQVAKSTTLTGEEAVSALQRILPITDLVGREFKTTVSEGLLRVAGIAKDIAVDPDAILGEFRKLSDRFSIDSMKLQALISSTTGTNIDALLDSKDYVGVFKQLQLSTIELRDSFGEGQEGIDMFNRSVEKISEAYGINSDLLRRLANTSVTDFNKSLEKITNSAGNSIEKQALLARESFEKQWKRIREGIGGFFGSIGDDIVKKLLPVTTQLGNEFSKISDKYNKLPQGNKDLYSGLLLVLGTVAAIGVTFRSLSIGVSFAVQGITQLVKPLGWMTGTTGIIGKGWIGISKALGVVAATFGIALSFMAGFEKSQGRAFDTWKGIQALVIATFRLLAPMWEVMVTPLKVAFGWLSSIFTFITDFVSHVFKGEFYSAFSDIGAFAFNIFADIVNAMIDVANTVAAIWGGVAFGDEWRWQKKTGSEAGIKNIPKAAAGGIVERDMIAHVGERNVPEAIIPLHKLPEMVQQIQPQTSPFMVPQETAIRMKVADRVSDNISNNGSDNDGVEQRLDRMVGLLMELVSVVKSGRSRSGSDMMIAKGIT